MRIEDKLYCVRYNVDNKEAHIKLKDKETCNKCEIKYCTWVCPAENYKFENGELHFSYDGCMECGACRLSCPEEHLDWNYPKGGFGVCFRFG